jgi:hypothetical protein
MKNTHILKPPLGSGPRAQKEGDKNRGSRNQGVESPPNSTNEGLEDAQAIQEAIELSLTEKAPQETRLNTTGNKITTDVTLLTLQFLITRPQKKSAQVLTKKKDPQSTATIFRGPYQKQDEIR